MADTGSKITRADALEIFRYDPETGNLYHRTKGIRWFQNFSYMDRWNKRYAGKEIRTKQSDGYLHVSITKNGQMRFYRVHRVIWLMVHGEWPDEVDHINHRRDDNRIVNLRSVSRGDNTKNLGLSKSNTSGVNGVHWDKRESKWRSQIQLKGKVITLGYFADLSEAAKARQAAEQKHGFHENHGKARESSNG